MKRKPGRKKHSRPYARRGPDRTAGGDGEVLVLVSSLPSPTERREKGDSHGRGEKEGESQAKIGNPILQLIKGGEASQLWNEETNEAAKQWQPNSAMFFYRLELEEKGKRTQQEGDVVTCVIHSYCSLPTETESSLRSPCCLPSCRCILTSSSRQNRRWLPRLGDNVWNSGWSSMCGREQSLGAFMIDRSGLFPCSFFSSPLLRQLPGKKQIGALVTWIGGVFWSVQICTRNLMLSTCFSSRQCGNGRPFLLSPCQLFLYRKKSYAFYVSRGGIRSRSNASI